MNRTKIEWTDFSWNPITGCKHGCWYCYAKKLSQRFKKIFPNGFEPTFYPERLKEPSEHKKPSKIFVCSIADLFASWTPQVWKEAVWDSMLFCPVKHTFQLLTKNPENIPKDVEYPENFWFGTTVTCENNDWKNIEEIKKVNAKVRFTSFEPLLGLIPDEICLDGLQWVIIGKLTGSKRVKLDNYWVWRILNEARSHNIPVFIKNNVGWPEKIQDFPREVLGV
jgi:protein gp37